MPTIARRTPTTEEAASYGYRDLLKDIIGKIPTGATSNVERMTSGGMSEEEILETALAPAGGMLKIAGTSKLLAGMLAREASHIRAARMSGFGKTYIKNLEKAYKGTRNVFQETLKVPEKEYRRIKGIEWKGMGHLGEYSPSTKKIFLHPKLETPETVWHEFTHARIGSPEPKEIAKALALDLMTLKASFETKLPGWKFYHEVSPIEKHARKVGRIMTKKPTPDSFSGVFREALEESLAEAEKLLDRETIRNIWETAMSSQARRIR